MSDSTDSNFVASPEGSVAALDAARSTRHRAALPVVALHLLDTPA